MQYALFISGLLGFLLVYLFLPETSHPGARGVEKQFDLASPLETRQKESIFARWVWLNPLTSLNLLRSPNLLAVVSALCYDLPYP